MPPTIRRLMENFALCRIGPKPIPPCSPSRLVALSRCPDAMYILTGRTSCGNGTKVTRINHRRRVGAKEIRVRAVRLWVLRWLNDFLQQNVSHQEVIASLILPIYRTCSLSERRRSQLYQTDPWLDCCFAFSASLLSSSRIARTRNSRFSCSAF
jgi:hypothetical protein